MAYAVGTVLALLTALFGRLSRFDRDRAFYPTVLVVIASYYNLFAALGGSAHALLWELVQLAVFASVAIVGFRTSLWWVVAGSAGHGVFDFVHGRLIANPGVPVWWPGFCGTYDVVFAAILAWLLYRNVVPARATTGGAISSVG